ncbi:LysR family transcriptional regulator [Nocardioides daejeonensis]|uniref:LysR family transcriptional regulator n=1 Tax=Nocardioides daejeonensis TaxID=1046556 RepID=UPI000D7429A2|nr:LysR family transcriptional regulator [Nocardioides daejeonensis]
MELRQLRYVLAVAETRSFTRAAERCFVVQSALSHQVQALERELGVRLFARTSRRVELTAAGAAFLPAARASVEAAARAAADAHAAAGRISGTLTIGLIPTVTALDVPATLRSFLHRHPEVRISVRSGGSLEFTEAIGAGEVDVAVLGLHESQPPRHVATTELARGRHVAVLGRRHRLARRRRLDLAELAAEPFADFPARLPGRLQSDVAFEAAGLTREVRFEAMTASLMLDLVRAGLAVALLPKAVVPEDPELVTVAVRGGPTRIEYLAWSPFNPSPATTALLEVVHERLDARPRQGDGPGPSGSPA